jgi:endonuclease/exonuclease/phosphatase family metal-dependent hydrolase
MMVGCYIGVYFKKKMLNRIKPKSIKFCKVKSGAMGYTGNKGAVCVRFEIDNQNLMFINCHLMSGRRKDTQRLEQLGSILKASFANNLRQRGMGIENHQFAVVMGDLNFRIDAFSRQEVL